MTVQQNACLQSKKVPAAGAAPKNVSLLLSQRSRIAETKPLVWVIDSLASVPKHVAQKVMTSEAKAMQASQKAHRK